MQESIADNEISARTATDGVVVCGGGAGKEVSRNANRLGYRFVKRAFDLVFSSVVIVVGFVPALVLSAFVAKDTGGTPIYSQERVGKDGKPFRIYKFRSMVADADDVEKHLDADQLEEWHRERKVENDPRITKLGGFLRRTSLDELPQFLNVWMGQMSVIGPRPVSYEEMCWFTPEEQVRLLSVPGGITGLWQATARNDATFESGERQAIELEYVRSAGFLIDIQCFLGTFAAMFGKDKTGR